MPLNTPGVILGYRRNGSPIWLIQGGSEGAAEAGAESAEGSEGGDGEQAAATYTAADIAKLTTALERERSIGRANKAAAAELVRLKSESATDSEKAVTAARAEAAKEVTGRFTQRLAGLSIRAAAGGKFQNPDDATALLSGRMAEFVNDEGDVDDTAISKAVDVLLKDRPYLGVVKEKTPPDFDGGQRTGASGTTDMNRLIRNKAGIQ